MTRPHPRLAVLLTIPLLVGLGAVGCGADDTQPAGDAGVDVVEIPESDLQCSDFPARFNCGGDPVGTWEIATHCPGPVEPERLAETCPGTTFSASGYGEGSIVFDSDRSYSWVMLPERIDTTVRFPLSCYGGSPLACSGTSFDGSCEVDDTMCICEVPYEEDVLEVGYWERIVSPKIVLYPGDGETGLEHTYCVDGNVLRLYRPATEGYPQRITVLRRVLTR